MGGRAQHRIGDFGQTKASDLLVAADFFDAEVERVDLMRVDRDGRVTGAPEHGGRGRARQAAADDRNVGAFHRESLPGCDNLAAGRANKCSVGSPVLAPNGQNIALGCIYPGKINRLGAV